MSTNNPPTYAFGAFNNAFYSSEYLEYPVAQGAERIQTLYTSSISNAGAISVLSSASTLDLVGNDNVSLNSRTAATNIAGEVTSMSSRTGTLTIQGNDNVSLSSRIGSTTIGNNTTAVSIPAGIQLGNGSNIQFGTGASNPTVNQLGWNTSSVNASQSLATTPSKQLMIFYNLPIGIYLLTFSVSCNSYSVGSAKVNFTVNKFQCNSSLQTDNPGAAGTGAEIPVTFTGVYIPTNAVNSFEITAVASAGTITASNPRYTIIRIA